ncbi:unnamed protein product [Brachionus calyciflorus]|uniref:Uncharacterized protein n=1 Tax=Brachionus calyciflorus TaxID=104777 RepID=A0A814BUB4_9BILA|nr:unnamed protein product [Brachionus calyciflorus]
MGSGPSIENRQVEALMRQQNPNIREIAERLPKNQEIRVKKIYHVNKPITESTPPPPPPPQPKTVISKPVQVVKVIQPQSVPIPPPTVVYRPQMVANPNASQIQFAYNKPFIRN